jgi:hypothetical protein
MGVWGVGGRLMLFVSEWRGLDDRGWMEREAVVG